MGRSLDIVWVPAGPSEAFGAGDHRVHSGLIHRNYSERGVVRQTNRDMQNGRIVHARKARGGAITHSMAATSYAAGGLKMPFYIAFCVTHYATRVATPT